MYIYIYICISCVSNRFTLKKTFGKVSFRFKTILLQNPKFEIQDPNPNPKIQNYPRQTQNTKSESKI